MTERGLFQVQAAEREFYRKIHGMTPCNKVHSWLAATREGKWLRSRPGKKWCDSISVLAWYRLGVGVSRTTSCSL